MFSKVGGQFDIKLVSNNMPMLKKLHIRGWVSQLRNLVKLILVDNHVLDDSMKSLQYLPNLLSLTLCDCFGDETFHILGGGFHGLEELHLENMHGLKSIFIDDGAFSSLKRIRLWSIGRLTMVLSPSRIDFIFSLIQLQDGFVELIPPGPSPIKRTWKHTNEQVMRAALIFKRLKCNFPP